MGTGTANTGSQSPFLQQALKATQQEVANALLFSLADAAAEPEAEPFAIPGALNLDGLLEREFLQKEVRDRALVDAWDATPAIELPAPQLNGEICVLAEEEMVDHKSGEARDDEAPKQLCVKFPAIHVAAP